MLGASLPLTGSLYGMGRKGVELPLVLPIGLLARGWYTGEIPGVFPWRLLGLGGYNGGNRGPL